ILDARTRDRFEVTRQRTNTPLQALVMLNDPVILEASRVLSGTMLKAMPDAKPVTYIEQAFRRILGRDPSTKEKALMEAYYAGELERYRAAPDAAKAFLAVGEAPQESSVPMVEHAALMAAVHALYNLEEAITRS